MIFIFNINQCETLTLSTARQSHCCSDNDQGMHISWRKHISKALPRLRLLNLIRCVMACKMHFASTIQPPYPDFRSRARVLYDLQSGLVLKVLCYRSIYYLPSLKFSSQEEMRTEKSNIAFVSCFLNFFLLIPC